MSDTEIMDFVKLWRKSNPHIVGFWRKFQSDVIEVIETHKPKDSYCFKIYYEFGFLRILLPSGRSISYVRPHVEQNGRFQEVTYEGTNQETGHWGKLRIWGGKFLENVVQAIARDILCNALGTLSRLNIPVVMHVHDECICDVPKGKYPVDYINLVLCDLPNWCKDMTLS